MSSLSQKIAISICLTILGIWLLSLAAIHYTLKDGPISLTSFKIYAQEKIESDFPGYSFELADFQLAKGKGLLPLKFYITGLNIRNDRQEQIFSFDRLGVRFDIFDLFKGKLTPRTVDLENGHLQIEKNAKDHLYIGFAQIGKVDQVSESEAVPDHFQLKYLTQKLESLTSIFGHIKKVHLKNLNLDYVDETNGVYFHIPALNAQFTNHLTKVTAALDFNLFCGEAKTSYMLQFDYDRLSHLALLHADVKDFNLSDLLKINPQFLPASFPLQKLKFDASIRLTYNFLQEELLGSIDLDHGSGQIIHEKFSAPLDIEHLKSEILFKKEAPFVELTHLNFKVQDMPISIRGQIDQSSSGLFSSPKIKVHAQVEHVDMAKLPSYWPKGLAVHARNWVLKNISIGQAQKAQIEVELDSSDPLNTMSLNSLSLKKMAGEIDFRDLVVDYFSPLPKGDHGTGKALFDRHHFEIHLDSGRVNGLDVQHGVIDITGLDMLDQFISIDVQANGPANKAVEIPGHPYLNLLEPYDISSDEVTGHAQAQIHFDFPIKQDLTIKEVNFAIRGQFDHLAIKEIADHFRIEGADIDLELTPQQLNVSGMTQVNNNPMQLMWSEKFSLPAGQENRKLTLNGPVSSQTISQFSPHLARIIQDKVPMQVVVTQKSQSPDTLIYLKADLTSVPLEGDIVNYKKPKGKKAQASLEGVRENEQFKQMNFSFKAEDANISGEVGLDPQTGEVVVFNIPHFQIGKTDVTIGMVLDEHKINKIMVKGRALEFNNLWEKRKDYFDPAKKQTADYEFDFQVDRLLFDDEQSLKNVSLQIDHKNNHYDMFKLSANGEQNINLNLSLQENPKLQRYEIDAEVSNLGKILSMMHIYEPMKMGDLVIRGYGAKDTRHYQGDFELTNYRLQGDVSTLAKLINLLSLQGLGNTLANQGIVFKHTKGAYQFRNELLSIEEMDTSGSSLGLTADGVVNLTTETMDMSGTVVPMYSLNKVIGSVPLIGELIIGKKGEGVFAAQYKIKGEIKEPQVKVNPVSVLTPGIIRKLFFTTDHKSDFENQISEMPENPVKKSD